MTFPLIVTCCVPPAGNYIVVFDPLDGSSNIDAGISVGSIWGIYEPSQECPIDAMDDPQKMMVGNFAVLTISGCLGLCGSFGQAGQMHGPVVASLTCASRILALLAIK